MTVGPGVEIEELTLFGASRFRIVCVCGWRTPAGLGNRRYVRRLFALHQDGCNA